MRLTHDAEFHTQLVEAANVLRRSRSLAILTGAGISAESGVPTFRASDGLWEGHRIEDVATPDGFAHNPQLVWQFYNARRDGLTRVEPNPGHHALVALEQRFAPHFALITQNVDNLHLRAGSQRVYELHGNLQRTRCLGCERVEDRGLEVLGERPVCPHCGHFLRPDIVWFHEMLPQDIWGAALEAVHDCDVMLVVGTSAVVHPAAGLVPLARRKRPPATVIEINLIPSAVQDVVDIGLYGPAGEILPAILQLLTSEK